MTSNLTPTVGVVTVTYNSGEVLPDFIDSLIATELGGVRIYAIDNDSRDDSVAQLESASAEGLDLRIIRNSENVGVAEGNNQGIEAALADGCRWILLLNNDTVFGAGLIGSLIDQADSAGVDLLSPLIEAADPPNTVWYSDGVYLPREGYRTFHVAQGDPMPTNRRGMWKTGYASTCCLLVRPKVFANAGLMDPDYFVYFDDVDFAVRANRAGYQYWVTDVGVLLHKASSITGGPESPFALRWGSRNWALISRKQHTGIGRLWSYGVIFVRSFVRFCIGRDSFANYRVRLRAFREGMTMAIHDIPYPSTRVAG